MCQLKRSTIALPQLVPTMATGKRKLTDKSGWLRSQAQWAARLSDHCCRRALCTHQDYTKITPNLNCDMTNKHARKTISRSHLQNLQSWKTSNGWWNGATQTPAYQIPAQEKTLSEFEQKSQDYWKENGWDFQLRRRKRSVQGSDSVADTRDAVPLAPARIWAGPCHRTAPRLLQLL